MTQPVLDFPTEQIDSVSTIIAFQRDLGIQLRLFPAHASHPVEVELDLRVSDDLTGMYYIG